MGIEVNVVEISAGCAERRVREFEPGRQGGTAADMGLLDAVRFATGTSRGSCLA